ncbi:MAG: tRNA (N6-threonylcarbamoyladenosine(37)-N6)-methyltransferase TrmO [Synergistaceae bacterium]|nr:tRNA (N6-threonylcarbamoyladenosine(37)-N6)-methyltransferase TrmO [Synergistaceae bacterium]
MEKQNEMVLRPIGIVRSTLKNREECPKQGFENGPEAEIILEKCFREGVVGLDVGREIMVLTWLHLADRDKVKNIHPGGDLNRPPRGVFATRSPSRPNPLGLHRAKILEMTERGMKVAPLEVVDGTPVVDIKPVLEISREG